MWHLSEILQHGRLYPLTEGFPKALLPVGNKPMVYYSLRWLEEAKIKGTTQ
jgi:translation initiation factor eIF-2B subunit gamma